MKRIAANPATNSSNLLTIPKMGMTKAQVARPNFKAMNSLEGALVVMVRRYDASLQFVLRHQAELSDLPGALIAAGGHCLQR